MKMEILTNMNPRLEFKITVVLYEVNSNEFLRYKNGLKPFYEIRLNDMQG
jgi:hypothetical protein